MAQVVPASSSSSHHNRASPAATYKRQGSSLAQEANSASIILPLSATSYEVAWVALLCARGLCIAFFAGSVRALSVLDQPFMLYYSELLRPGLKPLLSPFAILYLLVAVAHGLQIAAMLVSSVKHRRLSMGGEPSPFAAPGATSQRPRLLQWGYRAWRYLYARDGLFGVASPYYHWRYVVRESIEIISQSIQAYNSSVLVGKPWINNLYVLIVVLNCLSSPVIHGLAARYKWTQAAERITCITVDTLLDAGTAVALPVILIVPYARAIDITFYSFDLEFVYNDVWFIGLINENRQIFPLGVVDLVLKFVPHVSIYLALGSIKSILRRRHPGHHQSQSQSHRSIGSTTPSSTAASSQQHRVVTLLHVCLAGLGLFMLACHLNVTMRVDDSHYFLDDCKHRIRPWFTGTRSACAVYEFNCHRRQVDGKMDDNVLDFLDAQSLVVLSLAHCPALHVSKSIQRFPNLLGLEIYNSTLISWTIQAAITSTSHPAITYVFVILTNLTELPAALLHGDLPPTLMDIEISHTNLTTVPDDLDLKWAQLLTLYIEYSQLTELSECLLRLPLDDFSVIGNEITTLPDFAIAKSAYYMVGLAANPLTQIPASMEQKLRDNIGFFNLVGTQIATLPDWLLLDDGNGQATTSGATLFMADTPFCHGRSQEEIETRFGDDAKVSCTFTDRRIRSRYPLAVTKPLHLP